MSASSGHTISTTDDPLPELKPITARVIQSPHYLNGRIRDFRLWYRDNEPLLSRYWDELGACLLPSERGGAADFWEFAAIAHEREEMRVLSEADSTAPLSQRSQMRTV